MFVAPCWHCIKCLKGGTVVFWDYLSHTNCILCDPNPSMNTEANVLGEKENLLVKCIIIIISLVILWLYYYTFYINFTTQFNDIK